MSSRQSESEVLAAGPVLHPNGTGDAITQEWANAVWAWYEVMRDVNNVAAGLKLPRGRVGTMVQVWASESTGGFTASIKAHDKGGGKREWVLYSSAKSPIDALRYVLAAAMAGDTAWREQTPRAMTRQPGTLPKLPDLG